MLTDDPAAATLTPEEIATFEELGTRRRVDAGEFLYQAGDEAYSFYVVTGGLVEITVDNDGEDRLLVSHGPGRFLGELNMLTGLRVFVSARVAEAGEVIEVPVEALKQVI